MHSLELLAPARNADIGIAAIDCGADAVYVAGPEFGARQAAGNPVEDIRRLTEYAHRFGARIFLALNTILYDNELRDARRLAAEAADAGVDGLIVQDLAVLDFQPGLPGSGASGTAAGLSLHASTQCAIRTPEKARFYESLGFSRLVLEREMSLEQIRAVREAVGCELEFFVHGALCVCYSGQCYLSEALAGRSANRGACIQACRSLYDLVDGDGNVLVKDKALLSLKDYNLLRRLEDLAEAGIGSFKIEGRLKNISYVRNVVRAYSLALDELVERHPETYRRASFGRIGGGFTPDLDKTFNRGCTELFLDGRRPDIPAEVRPSAPVSSPSGWSSTEAPKSMGEFVGTVESVRAAVPLRNRIRAAFQGEEVLRSARKGRQGGKDGGWNGRDDLLLILSPARRDLVLKNGDGFSFVNGNEIAGFRGDVCEGRTIRCKPVPGLRAGTRLWRNISSSFERELETCLPVRTIPVRVGITVSDPLEQGGGKRLQVRASSQDGREAAFERTAGNGTAQNPGRMKSLFESQIAKNTGIYSFALDSLDIETQDGAPPFLPVSALNSIRRDIAAQLDTLPCRRVPLPGPAARKEIPVPPGVFNDGAETASSGNAPTGAGAALTYKANVANAAARELYRSRGASSVEDAYEITHRMGVELMRTKYCIRYELGLCPVHQKSSGGSGPAKPLFLVNNGRRYALRFDCPRCEMTLAEG